MNKLLYVAIDYSKAYLLARLAFESKKVIYDDWLSDERRNKAAVLYEKIGSNFVEYIKSLYKVKNTEYLYDLSVGALEVFRDNLDEVWHYSYSGILNKLVFLPYIEHTIY